MRLALRKFVVDGSGPVSESTRVMRKTSYRTQIKQRISELEAEITELQQELEELRVAERVLDRIAAGGPDDEGDERSNAPQRQKEPTVADKIEEYVGILGPMESSDIHHTLQEEWRPDLQFTTVSSTLSRMKQRGRITNDGKRWLLPEQEEPSDAATSDGSTHSSDGGGRFAGAGARHSGPVGSTPTASTLNRQDLLGSASTGPVIHPKHGPKAG